MSIARLRELRMVGFKSFAERTVIQFGPGISAIVGPNGSGKSNLADALRWALGEQGRALRSRRAEDLIFAGSANRRAVGMADVSLVIDNTDRLLSVDFAEVELSRRLFRSGENEYLLNRQRIRLRDLVDLLDDANLADNAFLFIGQGMVDQALALRPEERRPLFEEAAGIRKHQRRRGRAEAELSEAEGNLERVRDLLAELRPQVRRLTAQAQQQEARAAAGAELAEALVASARARLGEADAGARRHAAILAESRRAADAALAALREAEEAAAASTRALTERADAEQQLRQTLDAARARVQELELTATRTASGVEALARDRQRVAGERAAATARAEEARQQLAVAVPDTEPAVEEALESAERRLAEATRDADQLRQADRADEARAAVARASRERLAADVDRAARRAAESARQLHSAEEQAATARALAASAAQRAVDAASAREMALAAEMAAEAAAATARDAAVTADAAATAAVEAAARARADEQGLAGRHEALAGQLDDGLEARLARLPQARLGRRLAAGLDVEPGLRLAVEAALGDALGGLLLDADDAPALAAAAATVLVLRDGGEARARDAERGAARLMDAVLEAGGGRLDAALRRDAEGHAARLLARSPWLPDLPAALALRALLPPGWRLVTRDGLVIDDLGVLRPAPGASTLERRAALDDVARRLERARADAVAAGALAAEAAARRSAAQAGVAAAREALELARRERRLAEEADRAAANAAQNASRDQAWQDAQLERARAEAATAADEASRRQAEMTALADDRDAPRDASDREALAALDARVGALRSERDRLAGIAADGRARRERALEARRRAEIGLGLAEARLEELATEEAGLGGREADLAAAHERQRAAQAEARGEQQRASAAFEASVAGARAERGALLAAEAAAAVAREQLRLSEQRERAAEVAEMEARLRADGAREGLLVELAAIGPDGLAALAAAGGAAAPEELPRSEQLPELLEAALEVALASWRTTQPAGAEHASMAAAAAPSLPASHEAPTGEAATAEPPSRARIAALRRRFDEVGAGNPFAAQELAEVSSRLASLESQRADLEHAIRETRDLIARLSDLMASQFRETFRALEGAFARRFQQLFGGGEAQLSLTDPADLASTGVEIMARPPGKRRQPLAMLSGGERALTAVALLIAMLEVRPVPFCVLDEVDAALDEANVGRFSAALRSLAEEIQFVVITHNRGTIEAADALYGVTVGQDAISRVVSLRLADLAEPELAASGVQA
jgi:chromosome segregation protein